ncbi:aldo/keto reductase [Marinoscillum furvescens]|uniref:Aryl-alcohol dehydrogenase-like predicted oxidoreductase n=1 Tax=Marinoscillum furvescens DSM 4134 TaxID=1122208 RepID=A0A3D9LGT4_MARFU|nr:aldo/keto reductase [Marinoscillum furvescens]REE05591.1 aryl-alcohol dehydrogenase-like predicted oxidoreductase [Marinoscillum furvescens DSM 4134]
MQYRMLGRTGLKVSEISLGTWQVGGGWGGAFDRKAADAIIQTAIEHGVNFLDTADVYDDQQSERAVADFVKKDRDKLLIATKIGRRLDPHTADAYTPDAMEEFVDDALKNTGLDYLDLVQLHCPPSPVYKDDELFARLEKIRSSGKVRHFGVSVEKVEEAMAAADYEVVETVQIIFNMFRQKPLDDCFSVLRERNIGIIARVPLASGLLSGKMTADREFDTNDHRNFNRNGEAFDKGETFSGVPLDMGLKAVSELKTLFGDEELYKYALRWILNFAEVSTVIPGASRPEQVISNVKAASLPAFNEDQLKSVKKIYDEYIRSAVHENW